MSEEIKRRAAGAKAIFIVFVCVLVLGVVLNNKFVKYSSFAIMFLGVVYFLAGNKMFFMFKKKKTKPEEPPKPHKEIVKELKEQKQKVKLELEIAKAQKQLGKINAEKKGENPLAKFLR